MRRRAEMAATGGCWPLPRPMPRYGQRYLSNALKFHVIRRATVPSSCCHLPVHSRAGLVPTATATRHESVLLLNVAVRVLLVIHPCRRPQPLRHELPNTSAHGTRGRLPPCRAESTGGWLQPNTLLPSTFVSTRRRFTPGIKQYPPKRWPYRRGQYLYPPRARSVGVCGQFDLSQPQPYPDPANRRGAATEAMFL